MKRQRGFSAIEVLVIAAILAIVMSVGVTAVRTADSPLPVSWGINGITESRCISGYLFTVGEGGHARQVLNGEGGGVRCEGASR